MSTQNSAEMWIVIPLLIGADLQDSGDLDTARKTFFAKNNKPTADQVKQILNFANISTATQDSLNYTTLTTAPLYPALQTVYSKTWTKSGYYPPTLCLLHAKTLKLVAQMLDLQSASTGLVAASKVGKARK